VQPGAQEFYDSLIGQLAGWGVDFIKYDDIVPYPQEIEAVSRAIKKCGRPIVLSLSPGGKVDPDHIESFRTANMLRVTPDIWDTQEDIDKCFDAWRKWQGKERPGFWSQLNRPQMKTFMTLRALSASPLMMGGDLPTLDQFSLRLITNRDVIECNQNGVMGKLVHEQGEIETWIVRRKGHTDKGWIGVFNRGESASQVTLTPQSLGLPANRAVRCTDIWNGGGFVIGQAQQRTAALPAHGVLFLRI